MVMVGNHETCISLFFYLQQQQRLLHFIIVVLAAVLATESKQRNDEKINWRVTERVERSHHHHHQTKDPKRPTESATRGRNKERARWCIQTSDFFPNWTLSPPLWERAFVECLCTMRAKRHNEKSHYPTSNCSE